MAKRNTILIIVTSIVFLIIALNFTVFNQSSFRCQEDMPCWNCETMGNHICGNK
jgi:hypothetical protein